MSAGSGSSSNKNATGSNDCTQHCAACCSSCHCIATSDASGGDSGNQHATSAVVEAIHLQLPPPSSRGSREQWLAEGRMDMTGLEPIFDSRRVQYFKACTRAFVMFVVIGSVFYIAAFICEWEGA